MKNQNNLKKQFNNTTIIMTINNKKINKNNKFRKTMN